MIGPESLDKYLCVCLAADAADAEREWGGVSPCLPSSPPFSLFTPSLLPSRADTETMAVREGGCTDWTALRRGLQIQKTPRSSDERGDHMRRQKGEGKWKKGGGHERSLVGEDG